MMLKPLGLVLPVVLMIGCNPQGPRGSHTLVTVLDDLMFVAATDRLPASGPEPAVSMIPMPGKLEAGIFYVFQTRSRLTTEELVFRRLPMKLQSAGATIRFAPQSDADMTQPEGDGAPLWSIVFELDGCRYLLQNSPNRLLAEKRKDWPAASRDNYLLSVQPPPRNPSD